MHYYSKDESQKLYQQVRTQRELLDSLPYLPEGINYIKMTYASDTSARQENLPQIQARTRHAIDIENTSPGAEKDGWCGLEGIYLTEESFGNTLIEMNYPRNIANDMAAEEDFWNGD